MLSDGWIEEVKYLLKKHPNIDLHPLDSIGYNQIICHLKGETNLKQLAEQINIKINKRDLKFIDAKAERYGISRSSLLKLMALNGELSVANLDREKLRLPVT